MESYPSLAPAAPVEIVELLDMYECWCSPQFHAHFQLPFKPGDSNATATLSGAAIGGSGAGGAGGVSTADAESNLLLQRLIAGRMWFGNSNSNKISNASGDANNNVVVGPSAIPTSNSSSYSGNGNGNGNDNGNGNGSVGLATLVRQLLQRSMDKGEQCSNWGSRPLTPVSKSNGA